MFPQLCQNASHLPEHFFATNCYSMHIMLDVFCWLAKKKMSSTALALQSALDQLTLYPMLNKLSWDWFWFWCFPQNEFQKWDAQTAEGPIGSKGTNHIISPFLWFFDTPLPNLSTFLVCLLETILLYKLNFWWRYERLNQVNKKFDTVSISWSNQFFPNENPWSDIRHFRRLIFSHLVIHSRLACCEEIHSMTVVP